MSPPLTCPVCRARFRGTFACTRCGADLTPLMRLAAQALRLRNQARRSLLNGRPERARECALAAESLAPSRAARQIVLLTRWLGSGSSGEAGAWGAAVGE